MIENRNSIEGAVYKLYTLVCTLTKCRHSSTELNLYDQQKRVILSEHAQKTKTEKTA